MLIKMEQVKVLINPTEMKQTGGRRDGSLGDKKKLNSVVSWLTLNCVLFLFVSLLKNCLTVLLPFYVGCQAHGVRCFAHCSAVVSVLSLNFFLPPSFLSINIFDACISVFE